MASREISGRHPPQATRPRPGIWLLPRPRPPAPAPAPICPPGGQQPFQVDKSVKNLFSSRFHETGVFRK